MQILSRSLLELVANPVDGVDELFVAAGELTAKIFDMAIYGPIADNAMVLVASGHEPIPAKHETGMFQQRMKEPQLNGRQLDPLAIKLALQTTQIQHQPSITDHVTL